MECFVAETKSQMDLMLLRGIRSSVTRYLEALEMNVDQFGLGGVGKVAGILPRITPELSRTAARHGGVVHVTA